MQVKVVDKASGAVRIIQNDNHRRQQHDIAKQRNLMLRKQNNPGSESKESVNIIAKDAVK
jgi:hypothetical protein